MTPAGRRRFLGLLGLCALRPAWALRPDVPAPAAAQLDREESRRFRAWFVRLAEDQIRRPNRRWTHRDCAGLVRFAVAEALAEHDEAWRRHNGFVGERLPPPLALDTTRRNALRHRWVGLDGRVSAFVTAAALVQRNCQFATKVCAEAQPGDVLFFDQGDDQHLMVWMGGWIAYHTGTVTPRDNGLRAVSLNDLMQWKDTRWRPLAGNPNFLGVYRFSFLAA